MRDATIPDTLQPTVGAVSRDSHVRLQDELRTLSKREAVDRLHGMTPAKSRSWCERNLSRLMALEADEFHNVLCYVDRVGDLAVRRVMAGAS